MGRRDAVPFTLECVAEWRRLGALVTFEPGWERRGNGQSADYEGAEVHHTATPSSAARPFPTRNMLIVGRTGLPGPLCNEAVPVGPGDKPQIHVIAAHPANHAGASGGRNMGPLPVTRLFNPRVRGNEIDYEGNKPMTPGQRLAGLIHGRGVVNVLRRGTDYVRAHAETSITGKWDPGYAPGRTIDMNAFRRDAAALGSAPTPKPTPAPAPEDDMPYSEKDLSRIIKDSVWQAPYQDAVTGAPTQAWLMFRDMQARLGHIGGQVAAQQATIKELVSVVGKLTAGDDFDEEALVARIEGLIHVAVVQLDAEIDKGPVTPSV